jgi:hypothetical protein
MAEAPAEERDFPEQLRGGGSRLRVRGGIAGTVREDHAVGRVRKDGLGCLRGGNGGKGTSAGAQRGDNLFFHAVSSFGYVKYIIAETEKFVKRREFSFPSCQNEPIVIQ